MPDSRAAPFVLDRWFDILEGEPDRVPKAPVLHHYTDAFGLHGIITSNSLWATAAQFSNDLSEIQYSVSMAHAVMDDVWPAQKNLSPWEEMIFEHLKGFFTVPLPAYNQPYLISFCETGDLLSQWRAYGGRSGYSLAFTLLSNDESIAFRPEKGFRTLLRKVIYDPDRQKARLRFIFDKLIELVNGLPSAPTSPEGALFHREISLIIILEMSDWACAVKHSAFSEEREWRLITFPDFMSENPEGVMVRPTSDLLVPYMVLKPTGKRLPLVEIRCGPARLQEQSAKAVSILIGKQGYGDLPITRSETPLRI
jgi:hypothetical protein